MEGWQRSFKKAASSQVLPSPTLHWPQKGPRSRGTSIRVQPSSWLVAGAWAVFQHPSTTPWTQKLLPGSQRRVTTQDTKWASQRGASQEHLAPGCPFLLPSPPVNCSRQV